jgi:hypothetical protein
VHVHFPPRTSYRFDAFACAVTWGLAGSEYYELARQTCMDSENIYQHKAVWKKAWTKVGTGVMEGSDLDRYNSLPETVEV